MLTHIHIRDFAIIVELELELRGGLTVLSGETGAGKSIVVDALGLVLGDRADPEAIRYGADRAEITATFDVAGRDTVGDWLREQELHGDGECLIRRLISREGRSRAYVNGRALPLQSLRELGQHLVDIHGQQAHQSLMRRRVQLDILDFHGRHAELRARVSAAFGRWRGTADAFERLQADNAERADRIDLLRYQIRELEALGLARGEMQTLEEEHHRLANAGRLAEGAGAALALAFEHDELSAGDLLGRASSSLGPLVEIDPRLTEARDLLSEAEIHVSEAADTLRRYMSELEIEPARLEALEARIASSQQLARKHRIEPNELPARLEALRAQLQALENTDEQLEELAGEVEKARAAYRAGADELGERRRAAAASLDEQVSAMMQQLGMAGGSFETRLRGLEEDRAGADGMDRIEFAVSANPGHPPQPLAKVASGGELSRISLALQVVAAGATDLPCLVFDEVDAGIGGGVAEIVGRRLRELGTQRQVLCVTHLPQVASQSHHHVRVMKLTDGKTTRTTLRELKEDERVEELARMLGGVEITAGSRAHAHEMIARARGD